MAMCAKGYSLSSRGPGKAETDENQEKYSPTRDPGKDLEGVGNLGPCEWPGAGGSCRPTTIALTTERP